MTYGKTHNFQVVGLSILQLAHSYGQTDNKNSDLAPIFKNPSFDKRSLTLKFNDLINYFIVYSYILLLSYSYLYSIKMKTKKSDIT